jgi:AraC family transcriptional regulator
VEISPEISGRSAGLLVRSPHPGATVGVCGLSYECARFGPLLVLSMRHLGDYRHVGATWSRLLSLALRMGVPQSAPRMGVVYDDPTCTPVVEIRYDACLVTSVREVKALQLSSKIALGAGFRLESFGQCLAWRTVHNGGYNTLARVYAAVGAPAEFISAGFRGPATTPPYFELYRTDPTITPTDDNITEVYLPVLEER